MDRTAPLHTFGDALRHRAVLVLAVVALFLAGGAALVAVVPRTYEAEARLLVDNRWNGTQDLDTALLSSEHLALLFLQQVQSRTVLDSVISDLQLRMTPDQLSKRIDAQVVKGTSLIAIKVRMPGADEAAAVANRIAQAVVEQNRQEVAGRLQATQRYLADQLTALSAQIDSLQKAPAPPAGSSAAGTRQATLQGLEAQYASTYARAQDIAVSETRGQSSVAVGDPATPPVRPVSPDPLRWLLAALAAGIVAGVVVALLAEHLDDRVYTAEALARATGTSLVVAVPGARGPAVAGANPYALAHANLIARHPQAHRIMMAAASDRDRADDSAMRFGRAAVSAGQKVVVVQADALTTALPSRLEPNGHALTTVRVGASESPRLVSSAFLEANGHYDLAVLSVMAPQQSPTAVTMAPATDFAVLIATAGVTSASEAWRAAESLRQAGVQIAAAMLVAKGGAAECPDPAAGA